MNNKKKEEENIKVKGTENTINKIIGEKLPKLFKSSYQSIKNPNRLVQKRYPQHIKALNIQNKERMLKNIEGKKDQIT